MTKKIKLQRGRRDWEPPPHPTDWVIPMLIVIAVYYALLPLIRSWL